MRITAIVQAADADADANTNNDNSERHHIRVNQSKPIRSPIKDMQQLHQMESNDIFT